MTTTEIKGSHRDFSGTWWASIPLPMLSAQIEKWVNENIDVNSRITDTTVCKNCKTFDSHISVLLGLRDPAITIDVMRKRIGEMPSFNLGMGNIKAFELETKSVKCEKSGIVTHHKYQVLYIEVLPCEQLNKLQEILSETNDGVKWHHPKYNPHITVSFVKEGVAECFVGKTIPLNATQTMVDKITIKKFQDKTFTPIDLHLASV